MPTYVGFLRAINVGGNNMLPMKKLTKLLTGMGLGNVKTHLQSGNAVFETDVSDEFNLAKSIEDEIERASGFRPPFILRSEAEMIEVIKANPLMTSETNPSRMIVVFFRDRPDEQGIARLEPERFPDERFIIVGREMFVAYGDGMANSKFQSIYYERRLGTIGTARNWNTANKVVALMRS